LVEIDEDGNEKVTFGNGGMLYSRYFNTTAGPYYGWPHSFTDAQLAKCIYALSFNGLPYKHFFKQEVSSLLVNLKTIRIYSGNQYKSNLV
jgi:hypothetical protein